jgi:3-deoxy-7-phosphoheptulonate synthase
MSNQTPHRPSKEPNDWDYQPGRTSQIPTYDLNVEDFLPFITPMQVKKNLPLSPSAHRTVVKSRHVLKHILAGKDKRMLAMVGPCSIHDEKASLEYAGKLAALAEEFQDCLCIIMRVYFEKPRTTIGWKGLINDPHLDGSFDLEAGVALARRILLEITGMGLPAATEILGPIIPQYLADLVTWAAIGARTTESQTHRQMASGLSMPVGFKNGTGGNMQVALDAMRAGNHKHSFLGINDQGRISIIRTLGNPWTHLILRGGVGQPNYDPETVAEAESRLREANLSPAIVVDCSHDNSGKKFQNQPDAFYSVIDQRAAGNTSLIGVMLESNLNEGNQPLSEDLSQLKYGVSITDECLGWQQTEQMLREGARMLRKSGQGA